MACSHEITLFLPAFSSFCAEGLADIIAFARTHRFGLEWDEPASKSAIMEGWSVDAAKPLALYGRDGSFDMIEEILALGEEWERPIAVLDDSDNPESDAAGELSWYDPRSGRGSCPAGRLTSEPLIEGAALLRLPLMESLSLCTPPLALGITGDDKPMTLKRLQVIEDFKQDAWSENAQYPRSDWHEAVTARDTQLGYWEWILHQISAEA